MPKGVETELARRIKCKLFRWTDSWTSTTTPPLPKWRRPPRPSGLVGINGTAQPLKLVRIEEPRDLAARIPGDAETGIGVALAPSPFLSPDHHRAQDFQSTVGRARLVPSPDPTASSEDRNGADTLPRTPYRVGVSFALRASSAGFSPRWGRFHAERLSWGPPWARRQRSSNRWANPSCSGIFLPSQSSIP